MLRYFSIPASRGIVESELGMLIAARIRQVRIEHSLSLGELAERAGLSPSFLASVEDGNAVPSLEMFDRLAEAIGVPISNLFFDDTVAPVTSASTGSPTWQQLIGKIHRSASSLAVSLLTLRSLAAAKTLLSLIIRGGRWR
jgi:transcriptional regulator with XRE-family HTH domain